MASVKPYFDTRSPRKDGTCPLKLALTHKGNTVLVSLQIYLLPEAGIPKNRRSSKTNAKRFITTRSVVGWYWPKTSS